MSNRGGRRPINFVQEVLELEEWSDAQVVENDREKEVRMSYRTACHNYTVGFSLALFMVATVLAYLIMWQQHIPDSVFNTAVPFFVAFSILGFVLVGVSYLSPIQFYELMEDTNE